MKIRYTKGGMKTDLITMKAKQKSIEKKSYKRSKAKQAQKKPSPKQPLQQEMRTECSN